MKTPSSRTKLFDREIDLVTDPDLGSLARALDDGQASSIYFCNVHMLMLSQEDATLARAMDEADLVLADGVPVSWLQKKISGACAQTVRGHWLMLEICRHAEENNQGIGLIGSTPEVMAELVKSLKSRFKALTVGYHLSPPYSPGELISPKEDLDAINASGITWLFTGLGCPKQEKWVYRYKGELNCKILSVGAAFDWWAGTTGKPPDWMENMGLAWLYRLIQNPRKMWSRYLIYNTKFLMKTAQLLLSRSRLT